jgi:hypothetical protein
MVVRPHGHMSMVSETTSKTFLRKMPLKNIYLENQDRDEETG